MTHLRIELNTTPEIVASDVIHKLYETAKAIIDAEEANDVQESLVSLKGNLLVSKAYGDEIDWLETKFPDLHINVTVGTYVSFEDPVVELKLVNKFGDGTGVLVSDVTGSIKESWGFKNNTSITKFNELASFTNVTKISNGEYAFYNATNLELIDLKNITEIGSTDSLAFRGCSKLISVGDTSNLTIIGKQAFLGTKIQQISLPSVTKIYDDAFAYCSSLTQVNNLNASITEIPAECFKNCTSLASIDLSNVTSIGESAFEGCTGLTSVDLSSLTQIDNRAFKGCTGITSVDLSSCTTFGSKPFEECTNLTTITLSNSLTTLPAYALSGCTGLTTINGGSNIASYGEGALENCSSLATTIDLSNTTSIASKAFKGCSSVTFSNTDNVATFGDECFQKCNLISSFEFKDGVNIGIESFRNCAGLRFVRFKGSGICHFGAFRECSNLSSITFDSDIKLAPMSFGICSSLRTVDLSNISETSLFTSEYGVGSLFAQCFNLESVTLNTNITKLPQGMFSYCGDNLVMTIPSGVTEIGAECFYGTRAVLTVLATTPPTIDHNNTLISVQYIKVPAGTLSAYQSAPYWSDKASVITELPST